MCTNYCLRAAADLCLLQLNGASIKVAAERPIKVQLKLELLKSSVEVSAPVKAAVLLFGAVRTNIKFPQKGRENKRGGEREAGQGSALHINQLINNAKIARLPSCEACHARLSRECVFLAETETETERTRTTQSAAAAAEQSNHHGARSSCASPGAH